jgi:hypothetical protein
VVLAMVDSITGGGSFPECFLQTYQSFKIRAEYQSNEPSFFPG